jgi:hypothetical protein
MSTALGEIFRCYGTDKVEYASACEDFLRSRRQDVKKVLEVGIGTLIADAHSSMLGWGAPHYHGGSLRSWRDYFPQAQIFGIDVQPDTQFSEQRIQRQ